MGDAFGSIRATSHFFETRKTRPALVNPTTPEQNWGPSSGGRHIDSTCPGLFRMDTYTFSCMLKPYKDKHPPITHKDWFQGLMLLGTRSRTVSNFSCTKLKPTTMGFLAGPLVSMNQYRVSPTKTPELGLVRQTERSRPWSWTCFHS